MPRTYLVGKRKSLLGLLIHDFKYNSNRSLARPLAELIANSLPNFKNEEVIITPLPTASHHIRARGFDHTYLIAKHLARLKGYRIESLLLRAKNTVQVGTDEKTRRTQAKLAYQINPRIKIDSSKTYLLIDDVWTTGASLKSAVAIIKNNSNLKNKNLIIALLAVNNLD